VAKRMKIGSGYASVNLSQLRRDGFLSHTQYTRRSAAESALREDQDVDLFRADERDKCRCPSLIRACLLHWLPCIRLPFGSVPGPNALERQLTKRAQLDGEGERFTLKGHGHAVLGRASQRYPPYGERFFRECWPFLRECMPVRQPEGRRTRSGNSFGSTNSIRTNNLLVNHRDRKRAVRTNFGNRPGPKSTCR
jgi:hypothetical protein